MNRLRISQHTSVLGAIVEGNSIINATCRMTDVAKHTVRKLLRDMGCACAVCSAMKSGLSWAQR